MNKKLIYTGICLCLSGFVLSQTALAASGQNSGNSQSIKKCPFRASDVGVIAFPKGFSHFHYVEAGAEGNQDAFYQFCKDSDFGDTSDCGPISIHTTGVGLNIFGSNRGNVIEGSPFDDNICGNNGNDIIDGKEGNDHIYGNNGSDALYGDLGDDTLHGGNGNDFLSGYLDDNFTDDANDDGFDDTHVLLTDADSDKDHLYGGNGKDQLLGGPDIDDLHGENGKDDLDGGDSPDVISGGKGKDNCLDIGVDDCSETELEDEHGPGA